MLTLLVKTAVSAGMVLAITLVAERASTRFAGVLMGFPLGAGLSLFFIGVEQGPFFAADSALWSTQGILATLGFSVGYLLGIKWLEKQTLSSIAGCVFLGLTGFFTTAFCIRYLLPDNFGLRSVFLAIVLTACIIRFKSIPVKKIQHRGPLSPAQIGMRAGFTAAVILLITGMAKMIGPQWSGIFSTFPTTVLPAVVVLHYQYGSEPARTLFREFPLGLLAIIIFSLMISASYPNFGVYLGTVISYMVAGAYLLLYEMKFRKFLETRLHAIKITS